MGVGISMGGLAGAVAKEGAAGIISNAQIGFREADFEKKLNESFNSMIENAGRKNHGNSPPLRIEKTVRSRAGHVLRTVL